MTRANTATLNKKSAAGVALLPFLLLGGGAHAQDFTAGSIVNDMEPKERYPFVLGVVEGLSYARFVRDGKSDGVKCMYDWFLADGSIGEIYDAFEKYPDYAPGSVVLGLLERECGT